MSTRNICCRLCLAMNVPMYILSDSPLQNIYENLAKRALNSVGRPTVACYICYSQLWKCYGLMIKAVQADELLTQILLSPEGFQEETIFNIDRNAYNLIETISVCPTDSFEVAPSECSMVELMEVTLKDEPHPYPIVEETSVLVEDVKQERTEVIDEVSIEETELIIEDFRNEIKVEDSKKLDVIPIQSDSQDSTSLQLEQKQFEDGKKSEIIPQIPTTEQSSECKSKVKAGIKNINSNTIEMSVKRINKFKCNDCGETFSNQYKLLEHRGFTEKPFECTICPFKSNNKNSLKAHLKIHKEKEIFQCTECGKKFKMKRCFQAHLNYHNTGVKPFECTMCQKRFSCKMNIKRHLKIHNLERLFECDICQYRFLNKSALTVHLRKHTGERPFECTICHKKYRMKDDLNWHHLTHTGEKPFECTICKQKYTRKRLLLNHIAKTHIGEKPFECKICQQKFGDRDALRNHLKHSHNTG